MKSKQHTYPGDKVPKEQQTGQTRAYIDQLKQLKKRAQGLQIAKIMLANAVQTGEQRLTQAYQQLTQQKPKRMQMDIQGQD